MATSKSFKPRKKAAERKPLPVGRPRTYSEQHAESAYKLCLLGLTDEEIAEVFDIAPSTIYRWKAAHPAFSEALTRGRVIADAEVAASLRDRALGYSHDAVKVFPPREPGGEPIIVPYVEHYPPDTAAASLWLRNRQGALWREKTDVVHSGAIGLEAWVRESMEAKELQQARVVEHQPPKEQDPDGEGE